MILILNKCKEQDSAVVFEVSYLLGNAVAQVLYISWDQYHHI